MRKFVHWWCIHLSLHGVISCSGGFYISVLTPPYGWNPQNFYPKKKKNRKANMIFCCSNLRSFFLQPLRHLERSKCQQCTQSPGNKIWDNYEKILSIGGVDIKWNGPYVVGKSKERQLTQLPTNKYYPQFNFQGFNLSGGS